MTHIKQLEEKEFNQDNNMLLVKQDTTFATGDTYILSLKAHREQKVKYIKAVHTDKVTKNYCMLELTDVRPVEGQPLVELAGKD